MGWGGGGQLMRDPVVAGDGFTYDRPSIQAAQLKKTITIISNNNNNNIIFILFILLLLLSK